MIIIIIVTTTTTTIIIIIIIIIIILINNNNKIPIALHLFSFVLELAEVEGPGEQFPSLLPLLVYPALLVIEAL